MIESFVLALDQGTTNTKALLVGAGGDAVAGASVQVARRYPQSGWVEQDAVELWESALTAMKAVLGESRVRPACIAIANQRESVLVWDRATGRPLGPVVGWQCRRGAPLVAELRANAEPLVRELTGLPLDAAFSAPKLAWLLDSDPRLRAAAVRGDVRAGTIDSWLLWNLTGGAVHATDAGNASRTLLFDIHTLGWSDALLELFDIPRGCLPEVVVSAGICGEAVGLPELGGVPISALAADSHAALYGHGCVRSGLAKATYGTGTSVMTPTAASIPASRHGLAATVAWTTAAAATYALEGNILSSGSTVQWLADLLGLEGGPEEIERLAASVADAGGVHVVPGFAGLGAPHWDPDARGRIEGLSFSTERAHLARAALDSIAFQVADVVEALDLDLGSPLAELRVDGGASRNDSLVQLQADVLGRPVLRSESADAAALGAAYLGGLGVGIWADEAEVEELPRTFDRFEPRLPEDRREELLAGWRTALGRASSRAEAWTR